MQALLAITTLDIDRERRIVTVHSPELLYRAKRRVFVDQQIVIAEIFAGKHFCQSRSSCINLSSSFMYGMWVTSNKKGQLQSRFCP